MTKDYFKIIFAIGFYWLVSISLSFVNKWLLSDNDAELDVPFFITWFQVSVCFLFCSFISCFGEVLGSHNPIDSGFSIQTAVELVPLALIFCGMTSFNNLSLKDLGLSFYYVARSLTTVFNAIFSLLILKIYTTKEALGSCLLIMVGYVIGSSAEASSGYLPLYGLFNGIASSVFVALYAIYTKKYLSLVNNNIWLLQWYMSFNSMILLLLPMYLNDEIGTLYGSIPLNEYTFWGYMVFGSVLGVLIGFATGLQIKHTSPLTHNVSGTAKAAFQTLLSVIVFQEKKSVLWWLGNLVVLKGSILYAWFRHREMNSIDVDKDRLIK